MNRNRRVLYVSVGILVLLLVFCGIRGFYYNPYQNYHQTVKTFVTLSQLTHPDVMNFSLDQNKQSKFSLYYFQRFKIKKGDIHRKENKEYTGNLIYGKKDAKAEIDKRDEILKNIKTQRFFMEPQEVEIKNTLQPGNCYYYLGLKNPKELTELLSILSSFYSTAHRAIGKLEIAWIPILTSRDVDDMAIGLRGTARSDVAYAYDGDYSQGITGIYVDGAFAHEENFLQETITYLLTNQRDTEIACSTGLFGEISVQDLSQRLAYVKQKGMQAIGVVLIADENFIHHPLFDDLIPIQIEEMEPVVEKE